MTQVNCEHAKQFCCRPQAQQRWLDLAPASSTMVGLSRNLGARASRFPQDGDGCRLGGCQLKLANCPSTGSKRRAQTLRWRTGKCSKPPGTCSSACRPTRRGSSICRCTWRKTSACCRRKSYTAAAVSRWRVTCCAHAVVPSGDHQIWQLGADIMKRRRRSVRKRNRQRRLREAVEAVTGSQQVRDIGEASRIW